MSTSQLSSPESTSAARGSIADLKRIVEKSNINRNPFFERFKSARLPGGVLAQVFQQYYYYIRTFPQILAGTAFRVENESVRARLSRTVVSELGDGVGVPHFVMFERVLSSVGVQMQDWQSYHYEPETSQLVDGLREVFLSRPTNFALGGHYVIEEAGLPMIVALYEGFRLYPGWTVEDFGYFYLHMLVETDHVAWISEAVQLAATDARSRNEIDTGAREVAGLLSTFWAGLDRLCRNAAESSESSD